MDSNINVSIRIRPLPIEKEKNGFTTGINNSNNINSNTNSIMNWKVQKDAIHQSIQSPNDGKISIINSFSFDKIFTEEASTRVLFQEIAQPLLLDSLKGINVTIFAYGQTSAGKTFTMQGIPESPGIIPLSLDYLFQMIKEYEDKFDFSIRCSYIEIYNEIITDLLLADNTNLKIHETISKGIFIGNLCEEIVNSSRDALDLLQKGEDCRKIGKTNMNEYSSRSHVVFRLNIECREKFPSFPSNQKSGMGMEETDSNERDSFTMGPLKTSVINFVDLAGSERAALSGAEGTRLKEGCHINKSLLALSTVISKLSDGDGHIPYRDSKLTRILQSSLGGNSRTSIICAISILPEYAEETLGTLKFASRAKTVKNVITINEHFTDQELLKIKNMEIEKLNQNIVELKKRLGDDFVTFGKKIKLNSTLPIVDEESLLQSSLPISSSILPSFSFSSSSSSLVEEKWEILKGFLKNIFLKDFSEIKTELMEIGKFKDNQFESLNSILLKIKENNSKSREIEKSLKIKHKELEHDLMENQKIALDEMSQLYMENEKLKDELKESMIKGENLQISLQEALDRKCKICPDLLNDLDLLSDLISKLEIQCNSLPSKQIEYSKAIQRIESLQEESKLLRNKLADLHSQLLLQRDETVVLLESLDNKNKEYRQKEESLQIKLEREIKINEELEISTLKIKKDLIDLEEMQHEKLTESLNLNQIIKSLEMERENLNSSLKIKNEEMENLQNFINSQKSNNDDLKRESMENSKEILNLQAQITKLTDELVTERESLNKTTHSLKERNNLLEEEKIKAKQTETSLIEREREFSNLQRENLKLQESLNDQTKNLFSLEREKLTLESLHLKNIQNYEKDISNLTIKITQLENKLNNSQLEHQEAITGLQSEKQKIKSKLERIENENDKVIDDLLRKNEKLESQLNYTKESNMELIRDCENISTDRERLKAIIRESRERHEESESKLQLNYQILSDQFELFKNDSSSQIKQLQESLTNAITTTVASTTASINHQQNKNDNELEREEIENNPLFKEQLERKELLAKAQFTKLKMSFQEKLDKERLKSSLLEEEINDLKRLYSVK